jgi:DNA-binding LacI/PurR family transcriptional regulator
MRDSGSTVLFIEDPTQAAALHNIAASEGTRIPDDISMVVLGERTRPSAGGADFTRLVAPRPQLGSRAVELLDQIMNRGGAEQTQILLDCIIVDGATLAEVTR